MFVDIQNLSFRYSKKQQPIIDRFSFTIERGEIVGIVGASGSGKSTLLRLLAGLEDPTVGSIELDGRLIVGDNTYIEAEKRGVGMVFQNYALFPHLTVSENICFGLHKMKRPEKKKRLDEMLELVQLQEFAKRYPHELSGGQQQRVALARALAPSPSILLMDEPFSNLDTNLKSLIRMEVRDILQKANITCLFVSHDQADVDAICDRTIYIDCATYMGSEKESIPV
ncbi:ABC transporter ATP-binding protein [Sporosarcina sp. P21c]|uniref:ABC transporter ATP-binding protein n=1 Tax=Sporosarcina TaxID=1569 RepID=UPI000A14AC3E|nr:MULTISPECIES: ABC transporter ATP-binding protein [Sporosarcina]ARJ38176.1 ABC transporter [Sporosarcina ureae]PIC67010.1 ABC transporter ATP-binding protein [Sporosarcina sp. P16a]PIC83348.1 ABC transporter ATP-binding protein [Sporosarcina sp. P1]PIC88595.1 ABC transporter ATP-binding protein [Sporosarcina sp. P21c]PIC92462.1 ABC transporter ATP-binding protein [Sporosarcina sp. P25]